MISPVFKCLPDYLNKKTASWLQVLWASKKIQGEKAWREFEEQSKINYVPQNENRNRQIQDAVKEETLENLLNPSAIFLQHCTDELAGVRKLDKSFLDNSGILSGNTAMASMLTEWLSNTVFCVPTKSKQLVYIQNENTLLYERGFVNYDLRIKVTEYAQMLTRVYRNQYYKYCKSEEQRFQTILNSVESKAREADISVQLRTGVAGDNDDSLIAENSRHLATNEAGESNEQEMEMDSITSTSQSLDGVSGTDSEDESSEISEDGLPNGDNSELEKAYASFKTKEKVVKAALQHWVKCAQSTMQISNVITAVVPNFVAPEHWEHNLDACDTFGIPTLDGYLCDFKTKVIRKRTMTDFFSKSFNVNLPGSDTQFYEEMKEFI